MRVCQDENRFDIPDFLHEVLDADRIERAAYARTEGHDTQCEPKPAFEPMGRATHDGTKNDPARKLKEGDRISF